MYIILLLLAIAFAARETCTARTHSKFYDEHYVKADIKFFVPETFQYTDPCTPMTNLVFRKQYPQYLEGNQVEHIVDKENSEPELDRCNKHIIGNLVLANATWNMGMGNMCWRDIKVEKSQVYGYIFQKAMDNVKQCCGNGDIAVPDNMMVYALITISCICFLLLIVILVLSGCLCYVRGQAKVKHYDML